jgi:hypothetical protein
VTYDCVSDETVLRKPNEVADIHLPHVIAAFRHYSSAPRETLREEVRFLAPRREIEPECDQYDELQPARGILISLVLVIPFWAALLCLFLR